MITNTFFDFNDYEKPIKTYIDDTIFFPLIYDTFKQSFYYVR